MGKLIAGLAIGLMALGLAARTEAATAPPQPKLIVAISVDQFSAALFEQNRGRFHDGLKRLSDQGVVFANGYQSHAATETCPGHSTLLTGRHPAGTGIVGNTWYDPKAPDEVMYCVYDPAHRVPRRDKDPRGPANLRAKTLGEWLKDADARSRNFAVSGKDRSAITMAGANADGVFWWDAENWFTTSVPPKTTEQQRLAPVAAFNARLDADWAASPPAWQVLDTACTALSEKRTYGAFAVDHRLPPPGWTHKPGAPFRADKAFISWFRASPMFDQVILDLAGDLIDRFRLGRGPATDVLSVSLSATDYIGHRYGTQGPEMCDQLAHLDAALGRFLYKLAALSIPVVVVLTADHGGIDMAERVADRGVPAVRVTNKAMVAELNDALEKKFGLSAAPLTGDGQQIYLKAEVAAADPVRRRAILDETMALLDADLDVEKAFTKAELLATTVRKGVPPDELTLAERFAESTDPVRSGDISVALLPYASMELDSRDYIGGHGSPWNYDRRVPMIFWWPGAEGFEQSLPVETVDIAPTLAALARVKAPAVDGRCLDLDRTASNTCPSPP